MEKEKIPRRRSEEVRRMENGESREQEEERNSGKE
jgi:hypothetical protein